MIVKANGNKALTGLGFIFCYCKIFSRKKGENQNIDKMKKIYIYSYISQKLHTRSGGNAIKKKSSLKKGKISPQLLDGLLLPVKS